MFQSLTKKNNGKIDFSKNCLKITKSASEPKVPIKSILGTLKVHQCVIIPTYKSKFGQKVNKPFKGVFGQFKGAV